MASSTRWVAALLLLAPAMRAEAFPAFARKYGMACTACHQAWPVLNQQGVSFRDNGYQFDRGKDAPEALRPEYLPIAFRTFVGYQYTRTTNQESDSGPITVASGSVAHPEVDLLTGGTLARNISFLLVIAGFGRDGAASVESGWARLDNLGGSGWLNAKVGKFELDQPYSGHRALTLTAGFPAYSAHLPASAVGFDLAENHLGIEIDGHAPRSTTRYAVSLVSASGDPGSANAFSSPVIYGHLQQSLEPLASGLTWLRVGALGAVGWWPTEFSTLGGEPIAGTGRSHKRFYRAGADVAGYLGYPALPLAITVAYIYGREEEGLALDDSGSPMPANHFHSGFVELDWTPSIETVIFARYDALRFGTGPGNTDAGTLGVRHYVALGPRASIAVHLEGHAERVRGVGAGGDDVATQVVMAGLDLDF
jgi:hypothetical protein